MNYLLLHPEDIRDLVEMSEAIEAIEKAYADVTEWPVINVPRQRVHSPHSVRVSTFSGGSQSLGVIGVAEHAEKIGHSETVQKTFGRAHQVWILHDADTSELLAVMIGAINEKKIGWKGHTPNTQGSTTQTSLRTGATSGVGFKYLAREDSTTAGLLGAGNQAVTQLQALMTVRHIEHVKVYSPTLENREAFAKNISELLDVDISAADTAQEAVRDVDVILAATNSNVPVFSGEWLQPGQHVSTIVGSNAALVEGGWLKSQRREIDDLTVKRADVIVTNSRGSVVQDRQGDLYEPLEKGIIKLDDIWELGEIVLGTQSGRSSPEQITLHKNNNGLGCAEMAVAKLAYEKAVAAGRGIKMELSPVMGG